MKVEVLENGSVTLDELTVSSSLISKVRDLSNCEWGQLNDCVDVLEEYMDMAIEKSERCEIDDKVALDMIIYFRKIKSILLAFKS